jgi:hypothetical protein
MPTDPLYNQRDAVSRELIRKGFVADCFGTNYPLLTLLREAGVMDVVFQGTGVRNPYIYDFAHGSATEPGATINPTRKQMVSDSKYDIRFYESDIEVERTEYDLYNAAGDTQLVSQESIDNYCMTKRLESMVEMDAYQHGQWNSGSPGGGTAGVANDRHRSSNGFDEVFNNGVDPGPFGNYYLLTGGVTRNGVTGQAYNSTPYYCGTASGTAGSITWPVFQRAVAQLSVLGAKAKVGFVGPFGWGAIATAFRQQSVTMQLDVKEGTDFGWRSIDFNGIKIHEDPLCPSSAAFSFLPGGNPAAFGSTSAAKYYDGSGGSTQLSPFLTPTYKVNGVSAAAGSLSPTGSNIPSGITINPGEALYFIDPEAMVMLPPKPGSGWTFTFDENRIPNNISSSIRYLRLATNIYGDQPLHGMIIYGFKGVGQ